jgi:hypothetical protein
MEYTNNNNNDVRAYRTYAYDVYLPPSLSSLSSSRPHTVERSESSHCTNEPSITTTNTNNLTATTFLLFLPGAFVEHVSYAQPAALLSDQGYIVIVLSSESSWGIVDRFVPPFTVSYIQHIQKEMEQKHGGGGSDRQCRWVFMGHSMGSLTCTKLVSYFPNVHELVLWGSAPFLDYMENLSHLNDNNNISKSLNVLVVQGTKDDIIQRYCTPEMVQEYWNRLPTSTTTLYEIIGGTHHGFGNYIRNNNNTGSNDDTIPMHEQHAIAVQVTIDFLNQTKTKYR